MVQVQLFGTGTRYKLETLHQCGKRVKTKIQIVLESNSYVCGSYRGKLVGGTFLPPILNRVNSPDRVSSNRSILSSSRTVNRSLMQFSGRATSFFLVLLFSHKQLRLVFLVRR